MSIYRELPDLNPIIKSKLQITLESEGWDFLGNESVIDGSRAVPFPINLGVGLTESELRDRYQKMYDGRELLIAKAYNIEGKELLWMRALYIK